MKTHSVRVVLGLVSAVAILAAARCGSKGYATDTQIPGIGQEVPLVQVDGHALPTVIASDASEQTSVVGGKATLGEAIASGQYKISLLRGTGMSAMTSTVSGTVVFTWTETTVSAAIDLGAGLGSHTFTFQR